MSKRTLCVICGGQSAEHEVSLLSAANIIAAVDGDRFDTVVVGIGKDGEWGVYDTDCFLDHSGSDGRAVLSPEYSPAALVCREGRGELLGFREDGVIRIPFDVAFPVLHGTYGEDGTIQGVLKMSNVPFVGCDIASSANCMDKDIAKRLMSAAGYKVAPWVTFECPEEAVRAIGETVDRFGLPLYVKPARLGSSVGVTKVRKADGLSSALEEAFRYDSRILVEESIEGREIECSVLGNTEPRASLPGEVIPNSRYGGCYPYEAKYLADDGAVLRAPAELSPDVIAEVQNTAIGCFKALCCSGMARVDAFLLPSGEVIVNEINTIPGFTDISMYPRLWEVSGLSCTELVTSLVDYAVERFRQEQGLATDYSNSL